MTVDCHKAKEVMECVLAEAWGFFKTGDKNRDGFVDYEEFMVHPVYKEVGYDLRTRTFIFWMVDDNKDSKVSLQEWLNNEIGQFRMGDKNNDGLIDDKEYEAILRIQTKLYKDANLGGM
jgi:Ca2+-binding EF-hand superfamily protein